MTRRHAEPAPGPDPTLSAATALERARARLAGIRHLDTLIIRGTPPAEFAGAALAYLRALVRTGRATVIAYDEAAGTGTLLAVDEDDPLATVPVGRSFPLAAVVPRELLAAPATRVFRDIGAELPELGPTPDLLARGYRAAIWSPLVADGVLLGMLAMAATDASAFGGDGIEIVEEVAAQVAVGLKSANDAAAARHALTRLELLADVERAILESPTAGELADRMLPSLLAFLGGGRVSLVTYDHETGTGTLVAAHGDREIPGATPGLVLPLAAVLPPGILEDPGPRVYPDVERDLPTIVPSRERYGYRAAAFLPLVADGEVVAGLGVAGPDAARFRPEVMAVADEVARRLGVGLRSLRDREALRRAANRLAMLHRIDRAILDAEDTADLAHRAADLLRELLAAEQVIVARYDVAAGTGFRLAASGAGDTEPHELFVPVPLDQLITPGMVERPELVRLPDLAAAVDLAPGVALLAARGLVSGLYVPLVAQGRLQGALIAGWRDRAGLTDEHATIAREAADQLAIAIVHADAHDRLATSAARLSLVHAIDRAILAAEHPPEIASRVVEELRRLAGADRVAVTAFDVERGVSIVLAFSQAGAGPGFSPGTEIPLDSGLPDEVLVGRQILRVPDIAAMAERYPAWRSAAAQGMTAAVVVPLVAGDRLIGIISIAGREERVIGDEAVSVAAEIADQLAIAIEHAAARERVEHQNARLSLMREIDLAILDSTSPGELAARVAAPLARLTGARQLDISAYDPEHDEGRTLGFAPDDGSQTTPPGEVYPLREVVPMAADADPAVTVFDDLAPLVDQVPLVRNAVAAGLTRAAWVPLTAGGRLLGAIMMAGDQPSLTGPETIAVARAMGDQLAVALQHAQQRSALGEREARLRAILEASPNGILAVDQDGVIRYANPAAHRLFGSTPDDLAGRDHATLVPTAHQTAHGAQVAEWFAGDPEVRSHPLGIEARRLDGTTFPVHVLLAGVTTDGARLAIVTVVDLSDRAALEARLRQAERLQVLGEFAGILAHDVRNHLTAISWSADILAMDLPEGDPCHVDVELIQQATRDAVDMTRSVLEFARPAGDPRGRTSLEAHLAGSRTILDRVLGDAVSLDIEAEPGLPPVAINPTALTQVIGNLAANARDAMPEGGTFRIRARRHHVGPGAGEPGAPPLEPGTYVRLEVADTGLGMDEATRRRAFEAFYTTKTSASTARGTGLGLSSVFLIVTRCGGGIRVASEPGRGTTFTVDLPAPG